ncbi:S8/S53 family peptidase [Litorivicinus sp.]|nr:S8/S53 family peptidase [Litorivicinus sp.]
MFIYPICSMTEAGTSADFSHIQNSFMCEQIKKDLNLAPEVLTNALKIKITTDEIIKRHRAVIRKIILNESDKSLLQVEIISLANSLAAFRVTKSFNGRPQLFTQFDRNCSPLGTRQLIYNEDGVVKRLENSVTGMSVDLNPPLPIGAPSNNNLVRVAHIDSGVDYTNSGLAKGLAYDRDGILIGYDFWDNDPFPFDSDTAGSPFFPRQHGSYVLDILLSTGAPVAVMPFRYPRKEMTRMSEVVKIAALQGARIVMIPMGSRKKEDWTTLERAARDHPEIIFLFSAGNDNVNLDDVQIYPASLSAPNFLTVTSVLPDGKSAPGVNIGHVVQMGVVGENLPLKFAVGPKPTVSGTSFSLPKMAGFLACLIADDLTNTPSAILNKAFGLAHPSKRPEEFHYFLPDAVIAKHCQKREWRGSTIHKN